MRLVFIIVFMAIAITGVADVPHIIQIEKQSYIDTLAVKIKTDSKSEGGEISKYLPLILKYIYSKNAIPLGAPYAKYLKYSEFEVIVEVGFPTNGKINGNELIFKSFLSETLALVSTHKGPYQDVNQHYIAINEWMTKNQKSANGSSWEVYLTDPNSTTPDNYQTKIVFPIK